MAVEVYYTFCVKKEVMFIAKDDGERPIDIKTIKNLKKGGTLWTCPKFGRAWIINYSA